MSNVLMATLCNRCGNKVSEMWVSRDSKGFPSLEGCICGNCGAANCITRDWGEQITHSIIPPVEDGNVNRFEYSFTSEDGKKHTKKLDPKLVDKHFEKNSKGRSA